MANQAYVYLSVANLRLAGVCGTRKKCRACGRYNNLAPGANFNNARQAIVCGHCGAWIPVDVRSS